MADEKRQKARGDGAQIDDVSRLQDVFVMAVIALIGATISFGLYSQAKFAIVPALAVGSGLFIWLLSAHFLITRLRFKKLIDGRLSSLGGDVEKLKKELEVTDLLAEGHNDLMRAQETLEASAKALVERLDNQDIKLKVLHKISKENGSEKQQQLLEKQQVKVGELQGEMSQLNEAFQGVQKYYQEIISAGDERSKQSIVLMRAQLDILEMVVRQLAKENQGQFPQAQKMLNAIGGLKRMPVLTHGNVMQESRLQKISNALAQLPQGDAMDDAARAKSETFSANTASTEMMRDIRSDIDLNGEISDEQMLTLLNDAIQNDHFDLHLQPIVDLPDRDLRFYESFSQLRLPAGGFIDQNSYMPVAEAAELAPIIDNQTILQSIQVVQRLIDRGKGRILFCNLSLESLKDADFFAEFLDFMETNQWLSQHIIFEFTHDAIEQAGPFEFERITAIAELGFRFSVDRLNSFELDFAKLAEYGFAFVKADAALFLGDMVGAKAQIHVADLSDYLGRRNIQLIIDGVTRDPIVRQLRDYNVQFAQGDLFCEPKPVRPEVFEKSDKIAASA